jgi:hypothetical protein
MATIDIDQFFDDFRQEIILYATRDGAETPMSEAFTELMIEQLSSASVFDDAEVAPYKVHGVEVSGYSLSEDHEDLVVLVNVFKQVDKLETTTTAEIDAAVKRCMNFLEKVQIDLPKVVEESTPAFSMVIGIRDAIPEIKKVRIVVLTDGLAVIRGREVRKWLKRDVLIDVWDVRRLHQLAESGRPQESIDVDFVADFGGPIPCLTATEEADYRAMLAIIPGTVLAEIYDEYGARLLERNVRAFLQARGKVNGGIRKTILEEPERFLAYNNGISATASYVEVEQLPTGGFGIARIKDLQIVNGGQTTASIHHIAKRDRERAKAEIGKIFVQAKITVVEPEQLDEIVPLISRYANSQNKVNDADFEANSPFHVALEKLSRSVWAPSKPGEPRMTHWFYERARGQYADELSRQMTNAKKRDFKLQNPLNQKFSKTDLARFVNCWDQFPHIASLGSEKSFRFFTTERLKGQPTELTLEQFRVFVAKAILYRQTERIVTQKNYGGYRANIVAYTIALLSHMTEGNLDFERIWIEQGLSDQLEQIVGQLSGVVRNVIISAPGNGNVTEWCKKAACWEAVKKLKDELPRLILEKRVKSKPVKLTSAEAEDVLLDAIKSLGMQVDKAVLIEKTSLSNSQWATSIKALVESGVVGVEGSGANALYSLIE